MLSPQIANSIKGGFIAHERPEIRIVTDAGRLPTDTLDTPVPAAPTTENPFVSPMKSSVFFLKINTFSELLSIVRCFLIVQKDSVHGAYLFRKRRTPI